MFATMKTIFDPSYRKLIGWLTAERKSQSLTQVKLAEMLNFPNQTYISKIETFERKLGVSEFVKICQALDLNPHEGLEILIKSSQDF